MKVNSLIVLVLAWLSALLFVACGGPDEELVQAKVTERVAAFRKKKEQECREGLLRLAESQVDSLLMSEAVQSVNDSLSRLKPGKPYKPPAIPPLDSAKVKPLFEQ